MVQLSSGIYLSLISLTLRFKSIYIDAITHTDTYMQTHTGTCTQIPQYTTGESSTIALFLFITLKSNRSEN